MTRQIDLIRKGFTPAEAKVAALVIKGMTNAKAAKQLKLSEKTVKFHLTKIYKNLKIKSRSQLILWSLKDKDFK